MNTTTNQTSAAEMVAPTKAEEIAILRDAIARLGPLSYCGPWLAEQLGGIERDIASDFFPQMDRRACVLQCGEMLAGAKLQAQQVREAAEREVKALRERTLAECEAMRDGVARAICDAQRALIRW